MTKATLKYMAENYGLAAIEKRGSVLSPPFRSPQPDSAHREYDWNEAQGGDVIQQWSQLVIWQDSAITDPDPDSTVIIVV